jgi:hypothetical protein
MPSRPTVPVVAGVPNALFGEPAIASLPAPVVASSFGATPHRHLAQADDTRCGGGDRRIGIAPARGAAAH